ncbi:MAG: TIR domain-containing protein [Pyrinomonadaceae bacterium]|nr:TIR domain-containing protein [Pyrinomonadaceae bacterium]
MTLFPKIFISFSSRDQNEVRKLFSALHHQNIDVWDYSGDGQELPLAHSLEASLKRKIDECDYFIAVISPNSIHEEIGRHTRFEVLYALEQKLHEKNRILPIILDDPENKNAAWLDLYKEFRAIKWAEINFADNKSLEDNLREICDWLSVTYVPSSLRAKKVFFAQAFLEETETVEISNADFVQLMKIMNDCANYVLEENWEKARDKIRLFLMLAEANSPSAKFYYPIIILGVCHLQLNELENAKRELTSLIKDSTCKNQRMMGLALAALGQTHFALEEYEVALEFYEKAADFLPPGKDIPINKIISQVYAGKTSWDEKLLGEFDTSELSTDNSLKIIKIKGIVNYRKGDFYNAIKIFSSINLENLDECAAVYYGLSLMEAGYHESAINILSYIAEKLDSANIYHHLADIFMRCGYLEEALDVFAQKLCSYENREKWRRQFFIEYARILRYLDTKTNQRKICELCEMVLDFNTFSPPLTGEDYFYTGYANFLMGKNQLAKFDFDRSKGFCEIYYDKIDI